MLPWSVSANPVHTEIHRLVYKTGDRSLSVKQGILAMYV